MLTWPVFLTQYLAINEYKKGAEWKGFYNEISKGEYYLLPVSRKLIILQSLCDDALESEELKAEMRMREESEIGMDNDVPDILPADEVPRSVLPRYAKSSAGRDKEAMEIASKPNAEKLSGNSTSDFKENEGTDDADVDENGDECCLCGMDGTLLCCDGCPSVYHSRCIGVLKMLIPEGPWYCPECKINMFGPKIAKGTTLRGAEIFGKDLHGQLFLGTCDHLLVYVQNFYCPSWILSFDLLESVVLQVSKQMKFEVLFLLFSLNSNLCFGFPIFLNFLLQHLTLYELSYLRFHIYNFLKLMIAGSTSMVDIVSDITIRMIFQKFFKSSMHPCSTGLCTMVYAWQFYNSGIFQKVSGLFLI